MEYRDQDLAASALRNLNKHELNRRELKVDFASDNKNGVNLRGEEVRNRDLGEIMVGGGLCAQGDAEYTSEELFKMLSD